MYYKNCIKNLRLLFNSETFLQSEDYSDRLFISED